MLDIEKETLNLKCNACQNDFVCTFHTKNCPNCGFEFPQEDIQKIFYAYESNLLNSKAYKTNQKLSNVADSMEKRGSAISQLGCAIFMLPLAIFCLWFLITLFSN